MYIKGKDNITADAISRLDYDKKNNTRNINIHVHNMVLAKLFNGCVRKTTNSKAFQTNNMYIPIGTRTFANHLESARTNYSIISDMSHDNCEKSAIITAVDNNSVEKHLNYLFANISKKTRIRHIR